MVGCENRSQEDRQQACQAQHDPVEQLPFADLQLVIERLPEIDARIALRRQLRHVRNRLTRLQSHPEEVGALARDPFRHEPHRRRHGFDAAGVEIGPNDTRSDNGVPVSRDPALDGCIGGIAQREHNPTRIGAGRRRANRKAARRSIGIGGRLNLEAIATQFVEFAQGRDLDPSLVGRNGNRFECLCSATSRQHQARRDQEQEDCTPPDHPPASVLSSATRPYRT